MQLSLMQLFKVLINLKEWRVGDIAGFTKKYEDNPDNKRAEYFLSKNSSMQ